MKNLLIITLLFPLGLFATNPDYSGISKALNAGDATSLSAFFAGDLELTILDDDGSYEPTEAAEVLAKFFEENKVKSFSLVHKGTNNKNLHYAIGDLVTSSGSYRVCIYLKEVDGKYLVEELGIEEE